MPFRGKNVWIAGAWSGIGAALAREFTRENQHVSFSGRRSLELERVATKTLRPRRSKNPKIIMISSMHSSGAFPDDMRHLLVEDDSE